MLVDVESPAQCQVELVVRAASPLLPAPREVRGTVRLAAGVSTPELLVPAADLPEGGYQLTARLTTRLAVGAGPGWVGAVGGVDVLADWRHDPRYGFLTDFSPGAGGLADRVAAMARYHLTCVQLYDWMFRHYRLLPPTPEFTDALGRRMSLDSVGAAVDACHDQGMAALAYATVYAAEREFSDAHRDWQLHDDAGRACHLADLFFLMDLDPGGGWSEHMLGELRDVLDRLDVDGFHLDQYGYPRVARTLAGQRRDVAAGLVDFTGRADRLLAARRPHGGSILNNVNSWPIGQTAAGAQVANYIEVWKPHVDHRDLVALVDRARDLAPATPVILAAYPSFLRHRPPEDTAAGGLAALVAVTLAAGAWPLLVGEGDRILADPYYPEHLPLAGRPATVLRELFDAGVAWRDFLRHRDIRPVAEAFVVGPDAEITLDVPLSSRPVPGAVWVRMSARPGWTVVSLVNLCDAVSPRWDHPQPMPTRRSVRLRLPAGVDPGAVWVAAPDSPWRSVTAGSDHTVTVELESWTLLVARDA